MTAPSPHHSQQPANWQDEGSWLAAGPSLTPSERLALIDGIYDAGGDLLAAAQILGLPMRAVQRTRHADPDFAVEVSLACDVMSQRVASRLMRMLDDPDITPAARLGLAKQLIKQCPPAEWVQRLELVQSRSGESRPQRPQRTKPSQRQASPPPGGVALPPGTIERLRSMSRAERRAEAKQLANRLVTQAAEPPPAN